MSDFGSLKLNRNTIMGLNGQTTMTPADAGGTGPLNTKHGDGPKDCPRSTETKVTAHCC